MYARSVPAAVAAFLLLATGAAAQEVGSRLGPRDGADLPPTEIDRVRAGQPAPDFTLERFGGGSVTLSDYRGSKHVVLVFYRGNWCPYCIAQLRELASLLDEELKRDTELVLVSVDAMRETGMTMSRVARDGVEPDFVFLSDPESAVIGRYGILDPGGTRRGIAYPAIYVIDRSGTVRWAAVETDYRVRPSSETVLAAVRAAREP